MAEQDILFQHLFFLHEDGDDQLDVSVYSDGSNKCNDGRVHPIELFLEKTANALAKLPANDDEWDEPLGGEPLEKRAVLTGFAGLDAELAKARAAYIFRTDFDDIEEDGRLYAERLKKEWGVA